MMLNDPILAPAAVEFELERPSTGAIESWLTARLAEELREAEENLDPEARLAGYGLDSMTAVVLTGDLEEWLGLELPSTLVWDYPTIRQLASHLSERLQDDTFVGA
jgi:acyl carrier protein